MSKDTRFYVLLSNWTGYTSYNATVNLMAIDLDTSGKLTSAWNYTLTELSMRHLPPPSLSPSSPPPHNNRWTFECVVGRLVH